MRKMFTSRVRPGSDEARARPWRPVTALIRLDLPTFERPAKATSGTSGGGSWSIWAQPMTNSTGWAK